MDRIAEQIDLRSPHEYLVEHQCLRLQLDSYVPPVRDAAPTADSTVSFKPVLPCPACTGLSTFSGIPLTDSITSSIVPNN